jgi:4-amino-4-deoxy-L-arabinose transferase-like glycosyltransferase
MSFIRKNYIYISILILISLVLRVYNINLDDLWFDELASLWIADPTISWSETLERNIELNIGSHLIFSIILKYFFLLFGYDPNIARLVPLVFGVLSVPLIIYLTRILDKNNSWLLVGFLISINYYLISYSQELRSYSLTFFLCVLSLIFFLKILEKNKLLYNILFYLISLIAAVNHIFIFIILFSESLFLFFFYRSDKKKFLLINFNIFAIFFSYLLLMYDSLLVQISIEEFWIEQVKGDFFIDYYFSRFFGSKIMGLIYLSTLFYLLWNKRKLLLNHSNRLFLLLLILVNSYFLPVMYGFAGTPILTDRYIIFVLISIFILISVLIFKIENEKTKKIILIILITSTLINNYIEIFERKNTKPDFKKSILYIKNSNSQNLMLSDGDRISVNLVSNYIKLINVKNDKLKFYDNLDNSSFKNIWVICYLPTTAFICDKPLDLGDDFVRKKSLSFNLIKLEFYESINILD